MLTAATESHLGTYIRQVGGPARGIFQMEPATEQDIWDNLLFYKPKLATLLYDFDSSADNTLEWNLAYQILMARMHYLRVKEPLPKWDDVEGLAAYWKRYYNTPKGKGTIEKAVADYQRLVA
jgi:hypothetical protein